METTQDDVSFEKPVIGVMYCINRNQSLASRHRLPTYKRFLGSGALGLAMSETEIGVRGREADKP